MYETYLTVLQGEVNVRHASLINSSAGEIIQGGGGQIQVLHATPEQVARLQQTHQIQILQGDQIMVRFSIIPLCNVNNNLFIYIV